MTQPHGKKRSSIGAEMICPTQIARAGRIRIRSQRAAQVASWFGLDRTIAHKKKQRRNQRRRRESAQPLPQPSVGTITLITGVSGSGKSSLLRAMQSAQDERRWIDLAKLRPAKANVPLVDCFGAMDLSEVLALLSQVGLGEAWSYVRTFAELSDGQRWRFRLALALHRAMQADEHGGTIIACDEFAATLDRVTAMVVAHRLRRAIDRMANVAAVVATSHDDLVRPLAPDAIVRCDFGRIETTARRGCSRMNFSRIVT